MGVVDATRNININFGTAPRLRLKVFVHDTPAKIAVLFSSQSKPHSHFIARVGYHLTALQKGWNIIDIYAEQWENNAGEDWSNTMKVLRIRIEPEEGHFAPSVSWDQMIVNMAGVPGVMITFDDGFSSTYTKAFEYMNRFNAQGTVYVITDRIDKSPQYLTQEQLLEMDFHGWSIANHSHSHSKPLVSYEQDVIEFELTNAKNTLDKWGLTNSSNHVAYPWGNWNLDVLEMMKATGMKTGRITDYIHHDIWASNGQNYFIGTRLVDNLHTAEDIKQWIKQAIAQERIVGLCFHDLVDTDAGREQWLMKDFIEVIDYIYENNIPFITINDYYALATTNSLPIDDFYEIQKDTNLLVSKPGVIENDYFLQDVNYQVILENQTNQEFGDLVVFQDGSFNFSPRTGWVGSVTYQYRICVNDSCSETAMLTINVKEN
jgi:peptidoglycan/xylan/chitin deacetylase (PgdA/CDA1 family)